MTQHEQWSSTGCLESCPLPGHPPSTPAPCENMCYSQKCTPHPGSTSSYCLPLPSQKFPERVVSPWIHQFSTRRLMNPFVLSFSKHTEFILRGRMEDTNVCGKALWGSTRGGSVSHGCRARGLQCGVPRGMTAGGQGPQSLGEGQGWARWVPRQRGRQGLGVTQHGVSQAGRVDTVR